MSKDRTRPARRRPAAAPLPAERLKHVGLRPTRQRLALARILFSGPDRHVTAEQLYAEAQAADVGVSLATVYNTLNQFTAAGLLRELIPSPGCSYFDTNTEEHHHFFYEGNGVLVDLPYSAVTVSNLPAAPKGSTIARVDVVIRLTGQGPNS